MIFGKIRGGIAKQNWLTVGIELLIVAVGVFLGVQFGNWNEERAADRQEQRYLAKLAADFEFIETNLVEQIERSEKFASDTEALAQLISSDTPIVYEEVAPYLDAMLSASRPARPSSTFLEMQSAGALSSLDNPELRSALIEYQLQTEISERGLDWALDGFYPTRTVFKVLDRPAAVELLEDAYGEVVYMTIAHQLQLRYANTSLEQVRTIRTGIEESLK